VVGGSMGSMGSLDMVEALQNAVIDAAVNLWTQTGPYDLKKD
jgi:hypothetical protein